MWFLFRSDKPRRNESGRGDFFAAQLILKFNADRGAFFRFDGSEAFRTVRFKLANESIANLWNRLDEPRMPWVVTQRPPNVHHTLNQCVVSNRGAVPDVPQQLLLSDQALSLFQKVNQHLKSLLPQMTLFAVAPDATLCGINLDIREAIDSLGWEIHSRFTIRTSIRQLRLFVGCHRLPVAWCFNFSLNTESNM